MKASQKFVPGKNDISYVGSNFKINLYDQDMGTVSGVLFIRTLPKYMNDAEIATTYGPEKVSMADILSFLKTADRGEWYIFYPKGTTWAVSARWRGHGWNVEARSVACPFGWSGGRRVVSCGFSDTSKKTLSPSDSLTLSELAERVEKLEAFAEKVMELIPSLKEQ